MVHTTEAQMKALFDTIYPNRGRDILICSAPGRVNLIGEHTDYNEGYVLPVPLDLRVYAAGRPNWSNFINIYAADYHQKTSYSLDDIQYDQLHPWTNYLKVTTQALLDQGQHLSGCDILLKGDLPQEAGLSSSAAVEISTARLLKDLNGLHITPLEIAYIGKKAENEFVGVQCGVMDQFVASLGRENHALFLDCRTNYYENIPLPLDHSLVIVNTMIKRKLATSVYNERRKQCREGVGLVRQSIPEIKALRDLSINQLHELDGLPEPIWSRCYHVVTENQRVLQSTRALQRGDLKHLGTLMNASHESLRDHYQVSSPELDTLVEAARNTPGIKGARMTGAGFGGCTVNLVDKKEISCFIKIIVKHYQNATGIQADTYIV
jgi:galactokinase